MLPSGTDDGRGADDERELRAIRGRLKNLDRKLDTAQGRDRRSDDAPEARGQAMSLAFRIATELIAGVFVGGLLGWGLDRWLGTAPFLLIVCLLLGVAGGLLNSIRAAWKMQSAPKRDL